jgi:TPR repeat protein
MAANGTGVLRDEDRARALFQRACDAGYEEACKKLR